MHALPNNTTAVSLPADPCAVLTRFSHKASSNITTTKNDTKHQQATTPTCNTPQIPPAGPVFPIPLSMQNPPVILVTNPDPSNMTETHSGAASTRLPLGGYSFKPCHGAPRHLCSTGYREGVNIEAGVFIQGLFGKHIE